MKTTCEVCLFRQNDDSGVQIGCYANRAKDYSVENNHFVINDYCNSCRNETWYYYRDNPELSKDDLLTRIAYENRMNYSAVIIHDDNKITDDLYDTIRSISEVSVLPKTIFIITKLNILDASHLYTEALRRFPNIAMKVDMVESELSYNCLVCKGVRFASETQYVLFVDSKYTVSKETIQHLNNDIVQNGVYFNIFITGSFYVINHQLAEYLALTRLDESNTLEKVATEYLIEKDAVI